MLRIATVGTGWITDSFIAGAKSTGVWELAGVYSRSKEKAEEYAARHGAARAFWDLEKLAACPDIDGVYIASPNALHYAHCKAFLSAGKHVLCEKPLCARPRQLEELQGIAQQKGLVFLEAIMYMHQPQRELLRRALGEIGQVSFAKIDFCQRSSKLDAYLAGELPNIFNPALETGALMDLGVYCLFPALDLFGEPEHVQGSALLLDSGADGVGSVTLRYPDKLVTLTYSKLGQAAGASEFLGTQGTVTVDSISRLAYMYKNPRIGEPISLYGEDEKPVLMGREAADFHRYITQPEESREEAARCAELSLQVCRLMYQLRQQMGIRFPSDE